MEQPYISGHQPALKIGYDTEHCNEVYTMKKHSPHSAESPDYKRNRMKEVRAIVAMAVKRNQRVDQIGFVGTDIARSQIALQDLLSKSQEKHEAASGHIARLKQSYERLMKAYVDTHESLRSLQSRTLTANADYNETVTALEKAEFDLECMKTALRMMHDD